MKHLYIILTSTLIVGFITGIYIFIASSKPVVQPSVPTNKSGETEIIVDEYGGCEMLGCSSYRILEDGSYTFIQNDSNSEEERYNDLLSESRVDELINSINKSELKRIENSEFKGSCPTFVDGAAYRFEILIDSDRYVIDSCKNDIVGSQTLNDLVDYFQIFYITHVK